MVIYYGRKISCGLYGSVSGWVRDRNDCDRKLAAISPFLGGLTTYNYNLLFIGVIRY